MKYQKVSIAAFGHELPPRVLTSSAIEDRLAPVYSRLHLPEGRLELMTGIKERRYWPEEIRPSEVAARAGQNALERSPVPKDRIGCLIHASVCRDFLEPATANVVHDRLKLRPDCQVYDVSNACLGVISAILQVANMIELGQIEAGLVVAGENGKPLLDSTIDKLLADPAINRKTIKHSFASLTIGSGAVAVVVAREGAHQILGATVRAATEHHQLCRGGDAQGSADSGVGGSSTLDMSTDAEALLEAGIALARANYAAFLEELGWTNAAIDKAITHQVGRAHQRALFEALGLPFEKGYVTFDRLGNVGSVSLPISTALAAEEGFIQRGQNVALLGIGSGLSTVMMGVRW